MVSIQLHLVILLSVIFFRLAKADFYTSIYKLTLLIQEEQRLISALKKYITDEIKFGKDIPDELYSVLQKSEEAQADIADIKTYPENPINAFHLLYRIKNDWSTVYNVILCDSCGSSYSAKDFEVSYHVASKRIGDLPLEIDLEGAADSVIRLWNVYKFDIQLFLDGVIFDTKTNPLSAEEILYIARRADSNEQLYEAFHWMRELLRRFQNGGYKNSNVKEITVAKALAGIYNKNNMPWKSIDILDDFKTDALNCADSKLSRDMEYYKMRAASLPVGNRTRVFKRIITGHESEIREEYETLCRKDVKTETAKARLFCHWRRTSIPYKMVKEEILNNDPKIVMFHDVIYDEEITILRNEGSNKIERSRVLGAADNRKATGVVAELRVSQTAWLSDFEYPTLRKLAKRIEMITGLQTEHKLYRSHSEDFQVLNYGVGGMYEAHIDLLGYWAGDVTDDNDQCKGSGDRVATWMFYLSDVKVGGSTVFPLIKTRVPATKGAAAFWYNIKRNGDPDFRTKHAGCPVLLGSKWVSNKWIREAGQIFRRRCGIHKDDTDGVLTNDLMTQWRS